MGPTSYSQNNYEDIELRFPGDSNTNMCGNHGIEHIIRKAFRHQKLLATDHIVFHVANLFVVDSLSLLSVENSTHWYKAGNLSVVGDKNWELIDRGQHHVDESGISTWQKILARTKHVFCPFRFILGTYSV